VEAAMLELRESTARTPDLSVSSSTDDRTDRPIVLVCVQCETAITSSSERIEVEGHHEHFKVNPHGVSFRLGCFASATNVGVLGPAQRAWTWFAGYAWQIACCSGCGAHLGWLFVSDSHRFVGLLVDALREQE
jgi:hypothetical protein